MLLQINRNKKGISLVISYILLIAISIVMSIIVYQWLKTYVPSETLECDEGTSIFVRDIIYDCTSDTLDISVQNNGKFSVNGYYIRVSDSEEGLATIDISSKITDGGEEYGSTQSIMFGGDENELVPQEHTTSFFDVSDYEDSLVKIEIIPTRVQTIDNKKRLVSCSEAKIEESISCE